MCGMGLAVLVSGWVCGSLCAVGPEGLPMFPGKKINKKWSTEKSANRTNRTRKSKFLNGPPCARISGRFQGTFKGLEGFIVREM